MAWSDIFTLCFHLGFLFVSKLLSRVDKTPWIRGIANVSRTVLYCPRTFRYQINFVPLFRKNIRTILSVKFSCKTLGNIPWKVMGFSFKVAEHSFRARSGWCDSARSQGLQKQTCLRQRSVFVLNARSIFAIFLRNWMQRVDGFSLL